MFFFRNDLSDFGTTCQAQAKNENQTIAQGGVLCRFCHNVITDPGNGIFVNGAHSHIFANPHGYVFEIVCYKTAPGCLACFETSVDFSWFKGHHWQVVICRTCSSHLGWYFQSSESSFFGLICKNLIISP